MSSWKTALVCAVAVAAVTGAASTSAAADDDVSVATLSAHTSLAAHDGWLAWSERSNNSARLMLRAPDGTISPAKIKPERSGFDVSLGTGRSGRLVALYTRCTKKGGCDIYSYDVKSQRERELTEVSSPRWDEALPVQDGDRVAFVRRFSTRVGNVYDETMDRPTPKRRGSGEQSSCDLTYVRELGSTRPSRRLNRGLCAHINGMSIRGTNLVYTGTELMSSSLRTVSTKPGGRVRVLASNGWGEGGAAYLSDPTLVGNKVYLMRYSQRWGVTTAFLRVDLSTKSAAERRVRVNATGSFARDSTSGVSWFVQARPADSEQDSTGGPPCDAEAPCRLVRAGADPFTSATRTLLPDISMAEEFRAENGNVLVSGRVSSRRLSGDKVVATIPVPGLTVQVVATPPKGIATGCKQGSAEYVTDAAGRWSFALSGLLPAALYCTYNITAPAMDLGLPPVYVFGEAKKQPAH